MHTDYGRDLDLNLLRVFLVVADSGGVTKAAARLYLTQPAVSAALRRLSLAVGAPLFARAGRALVLTARGERLKAAARPLLEALVDAALSPGVFEPKTSARSVRLGLQDTSESWLLPPLLRALAKLAPEMRLIVTHVQFRNVESALTSGQVDLAVTVADEMPRSIQRLSLFHGGFVCLYDPRHARIKRLTREAYLAHAHVVVSYNADLRGVVEDALGIDRRVRIAVPSFQSIGALVDGSALLATVPAVVAREHLVRRPHLRTRPLPFELPGASMEMLWPRSTDDDPALSFVREHVIGIARAASRRALS